jgi:hypothetical protein
MVDRSAALPQLWERFCRGPILDEAGFKVAGDYHTRIWSDGFPKAGRQITQADDEATVAVGPWDSGNFSDACRAEAGWACGMLKLGAAEKPRAFCTWHRVADQRGADGTKRGFWEWRTALGPEGSTISPDTSFHVIRRLANETLPNLPTLVEPYEVDPSVSEGSRTVEDDDLRFWLRAFLSCRPVVLGGDAEQLVVALSAVWHALAPAPFLRPYLSAGYRIEGAYATRFTFSTVATGQLGKRAVRSAADLGAVSPGVKSMVKRLLDGVGFQSGLQGFNVGMLRPGMLSASEQRGRLLREQSADLALALRLKSEIVESKPLSYLAETSALDAPSMWAAHLANWPHVRTAAADAFWARRPEPAAGDRPLAQWAHVCTQASEIFDPRPAPPSPLRDELRWLQWVEAGLKQKRPQLGTPQPGAFTRPFELERIRPNWTLPEAECLLGEQPATALWLTEFLVARVDWLANGRPELASGSARRGLGEVVMLASKFWPRATRTPRVQSALFGLSLWALENREPELRFDRPARSADSILLGDPAQLLRAWEELSVEGMEGSPLLSTLSAVLKRSGASQLATKRFVARIEALAQQGADEAQIAKLVRFADSMGVELPCKSEPSVRHPLAALSKNEPLTKPRQIDDALKFRLPVKYARALALQMFRNWPGDTKPERTQRQNWLQFLQGFASPELYLLVAGEAGGSADGLTLNQIVESGHPNAAVLSIMLERALQDSDITLQAGPSVSVPLLLTAASSLQGPARPGRSLAEWVGPVMKGGLETALNLGQRRINALEAGRALSDCWRIRQACLNYGIACAPIKSNALPKPRVEKAIPALWLALITDQERAEYDVAKAEARRSGAAAVLNPLNSAASSLNEFAGRTPYQPDPAALIVAREAFREFVHLSSFRPRSSELRILHHFSSEVADDNVLALANRKLSDAWRSAICDSPARFLMQGLPTGKLEGAATTLVPQNKGDVGAWSSALTRMRAFVDNEPQTEHAFRNAKELLDHIIIPSVRAKLGAAFSSDQARETYLDATVRFSKLGISFLPPEVRKTIELQQLESDLRDSIMEATARKNATRRWPL